jgi:hypothetical protein
MADLGTPIRAASIDERRQQDLDDRRSEELERLVCDVVRDELARSPLITQDLLSARAVLAARAGAAGFAAVLAGAQDATSAGAAAGPDLT